MTYQELFDKLTPEQMNQQIAIFSGDEEQAHTDVIVEITEEDFYWEYDQCYGNLEQVKGDNPNDWEEVIKEYNCVPKGTVMLQINN
jgi:hypothetical protein